MASLATVADLENAPGLDLTGVSTAAQQRALDIATGRIITAIGWSPFEAERTLTLRCTAYGEALILPAQNVTAVSVDVDGTTLDTEDLDWTTPGSIVYLDRRVARSGTVTYTAGWPEGSMPQALVDACAELAGDLLENPRRLTSWRAGEATETYANSNGPDDDPRLAPYRLTPSIA
jgi:hypothetical protein